MLGLLLLVGLCQAGSADPSEDFRAAYEAYQQHIAAGRTAEAKASADRAHRLGSRLYGRQRPTVWPSVRRRYGGCRRDPYT